MTPAAYVCVDAGPPLKWWSGNQTAIKRRGSPARSNEEHTDRPASSTLRRTAFLTKVILRQELTPEQAEAAFTALQALPIRQLTVPAQRQRAWQLATEFGFATVYDATYLALAELQRCPFWTADKRLFDQVKARLPFVQWLGDYVPRTTIS